MEIENIIDFNVNKFLNESKQQNNKFKSWFSNSKIIENGKPLVCYHGSDNKEIKRFDESMIGYNSGNYGHYGYGFYFSTDIRESKIYGNAIYKCYIKIINPFTGTKKQLLELKNAGVNKVYDLVPISIDFQSLKDEYKNNLNISRFINDIEKYGRSDAWKNIKKLNIDVDGDTFNEIADLIEYSTLNKDVDGVPDYAIDSLESLNIKPKINMDFPHHQPLHWITNLGANSKEVTNVMKKLGYDGVWYGSEIVAFYPNQIKSIHNDGTWDADDINIYS